MHRKILIMGPPGASRTNPARCLAQFLNAAVFDADEDARQC
jgi:hypothetical protein